jgi:Family of unknown function (DUF6074)
MSASPQKARYVQSSKADVSKIIPFPQIKRRRFVTRNAIRLAALPHKTAEKILAAALRHQAAVMARKGIPPAVIERESRSLENAIRAELWHIVMMSPAPGGVA